MVSTKFIIWKSFFWILNELIIRIVTYRTFLFKKKTKLRLMFFVVDRFRPLMNIGIGWKRILFGIFVHENGTTVINQEISLVISMIKLIVWLDESSWDNRELNYNHVVSIILFHQYADMTMKTTNYFYFNQILHIQQPFIRHLNIEHTNFKEDSLIFKVIYPCYINFNGSIVKQNQSSYNLVFTILMFNYSLQLHFKLIFYPPVVSFHIFKSNHFLFKVFVSGHFVYLYLSILII